ncbi:MAG: CYTH domain-containing protein [Candidatus Paceibacterota bacterium]|jgi:adenylate cyclase class 2
MAIEIETKVLDIDKDQVIRLLISLKAKKIQETTLTVDWYRPIGTKEGEDLWFLRIRSNSEGRHEVTWKAKSKIRSGVRKHKEINFNIDSPEQLSDLFQEIGLEKYAHQEKIRISFLLNDWRFDIDQYPGMPAFVEIEGPSEPSIKKAMKLLKMENNKTWAKGERILIQDIYNLDWYDMKFKS